MSEFVSGVAIILALAAIIWYEETRFKAKINMAWKESRMKKDE